MFKVLHRANKKDKIKLSSNHKDFDYMINNNWLIQADNELKVDKSHRTVMLYSEYSGFVSITDEGKTQYFKARNTWIKWILGTIISVSSAFTIALLRLLLKY